jgi:hypothetical protein
MAGTKVDWTDGPTDAPTDDRWEPQMDDRSETRSDKTSADPFKQAVLSAAFSFE